MLSPHNLLLLIALISTCSSSRTSQEKAIHTAPNAVAKISQELQNPELQTQLAQIASIVKGRVGVEAMVLETGETVSNNPNEQLSVSLNPHDHFPMQSVYKLPIGMAVMKQVDAGKITLEQKVKVTKGDFISAGQYSPIRDNNPKGVEMSVNELLRYAISESDGTASDALMRLAGGPGAVQAYLNELKITEMIVLNTEKELGQDWQAQYRNWASPEAAVTLLRALHERQGLSETSQALLLKLLTESTPGPHRLKGLLPVGTVVAHKTGSSGSRNGITAATNDIGIITLPNGRHVAIAVFVSDSPADEATREGVIARVAKAVWDEWGK